MKRQIQILTLVVAAMVATGCSEKKKTDDIIATKPEMAKVQGPIRMQPYHTPTDVQWLGKNYHVEIQRMPDDSLRMVKDENGQKYVDNRIFLRVVRADGSVFFSRTFTRSAFDGLLNGQYLSHGLLESVVFDRAQGNYLKFAGSVCLPGSEDEFVPFELTVSNFGDVAIRAANDLDTYGGDSDEEDV